MRCVVQRGPEDVAREMRQMREYSHIFAAFGRVVTVMVRALR